MVGQDFKVTYFSFLLLINRVVMQYSHNGSLTATQNPDPLEELCGMFPYTNTHPQCPGPDTWEQYPLSPVALFISSTPSILFAKICASTSLSFCRQHGLRCQKAALLSEFSHSIMPPSKRGGPLESPHAPQVVPLRCSLLSF